MGDSKKKRSSSRKRKETKRPKRFSDFEKTSKALLAAGYTSARRITISNRSNDRMPHRDFCLAITSTSSDHRRISASAVVGPCNNATIGLEVDKNSRISATLNFSRQLFPSTTIKASAKLANYNSSMNSATLSFSGKFLPSTKFIASANFPNYNSSMLQIQYLGFQKHAALAISVVLNRLPSVNLSATVDISSIAIGMKATYKTSAGQFTAYDAGISVTEPICDASIILADKGDVVRASYVHYFDQAKKIVAVAEISRRFSKKENNFTVGGSWIMDYFTTIKGKLDYHGKLNVLLKHTFKPKYYFMISGEFNTKALDKHPRIGLALALSL